jgi:hypothetical protein
MIEQIYHLNDALAFHLLVFLLTSVMKMKKRSVHQSIKKKGSKKVKIIKVKSIPFKIDLLFTLLEFSLLNFAKSIYQNIEKIITYFMINVKFNFRLLFKNKLQYLMTIKKVYSLEIKSSFKIIFLYMELIK